MIEVITGPMFSGKSDELIRRLNRARLGRKTIAAIKPMLDNRYDERHIVSHGGSRIEAYPLEELSKLDRIVRGADVVGIDEAQFFGSEIVDQVRELGYDKDVIVAGLDMTCLLTPFGSMGELLAIADRVQKLTAVCKGCGGEASLTQRIHADGSPFPFDAPTDIQVGGAETYQARCRDCFKGTFK